MPDTTKEAPKAAPEVAPEVVKPSLRKASESVDPEVHQLLGLRYTAEQNGEKDAADAVTAQLAELGFE